VALKIAKWPFTTWLGVVSIIGFLAILINATTGADLSAIADSLLFIVIGLALFFSGGAKFFVYFKNGLTPSEINRLVTVAVGVASIITGILIAPFFGFNIVILNGIKIIIAIIAISVIAIETWFSK